MCRESDSGKAAVYARVSVSHDDKKDMTIDNQIMIAKRYIENHGLTTSYIYSDKGYSGRNFDRPGWKKLIRDASEGNFKNLVVKDLSRIGRNYIETGEYIEKIFMSMNIRVISVAEEYDSFSTTGDSLLFGLKNVINEWYARETGRKVSAVKQYKKSRGEFIGSTAPYGYKIILSEGKRIIVKDDSIFIVDLIKEMRKQGHTSAEIAVWLSVNHVNTPSEYNKTGEIYCTRHTAYKKWDSGTVRRLWNNSDTSGDYHTA